MEEHSIPFVPVVPMRMTEAWLLIDRAAICNAANNPHSKAKISLPDVKRLPTLPDPKAMLFDFLVEASELTGRKKDRFQRKLPYCRALVAKLIQDFSPLRTLPAFAEFEQATLAALDQVDLDE